MSNRPTLQQMLASQRRINQRLQDGVSRSAETEKAAKKKPGPKPKKVTDDADTSTEAGAGKADTDE